MYWKPLYLWSPYRDWPNSIWNNTHEVQRRHSPNASRKIFKSVPHPIILWKGTQTSTNPMISPWFFHFASVKLSFQSSPWPTTQQPAVQQSGTAALNHAKPGLKSNKGGISYSDWSQHKAFLRQFLCATFFATAHLVWVLGFPSLCISPSLSLSLSLSWYICILDWLKAGNA